MPRSSTLFALLSRGLTGRRVPDPREVSQIARIVELRERGFNLYRIAVTFQRERAKAVARREWSYDRVLRVYRAVLRGEVLGMRVGGSDRSLRTVPLT